LNPPGIVANDCDSPPNTPPEPLLSPIRSTSCMLLGLRVLGPGSSVNLGECLSATSIMAALRAERLLKDPRRCSSNASGLHGGPLATRLALDGSVRLTRFCSEASRECKESPGRAGASNSKGTTKHPPSPWGRPTRRLSSAAASCPSEAAISSSLLLIPGAREERKRGAETLACLRPFTYNCERRSPNVPPGCPQGTLGPGRDRSPSPGAFLVASGVRRPSRTPTWTGRSQRWTFVTGAGTARQ
jgi:hypothetical protein